MNRSEYFKAIRVPALLLIIQAILAYFFTYLTYRNVTSYEEISKIVFGALFFIIGYSLLLMAFHYGILFYSGWTIIKKYDGTIINAVYIGIFAGAIVLFLTYVNMAISYLTISGYRLSIAGEPGISQKFTTMLFFISMIFSVPFSLGIDVGFATLGGYVARRKK